MTHLDPAAPRHDLPLDDGPWVADQVGRRLQRLGPQRDSQPPRNRLR